MRLSNITIVGTSFVQDRPILVQCPYDNNHFVPADALEKHKQKCQYAALGIKADMEASRHWKAGLALADVGGGASSS